MCCCRRRKTGNGDLFRKGAQKIEEAVNVVTLYKKRIHGRGSEHGMHSVKVEAHRRYASISPKADLKVHVGHQQGCKVVTSLSK